jgi:uncharacterized membrane protein
MKTATTIFNWLIRITGLFQLIIGVIFWVNQDDNLVPFHMLVGVILVLSLWIMAFLAARAGVSWKLTALAFVWGLVVAILGLTQTQILSGNLHWLIEVLHLLLGLGAIGLGEGLSAGVKRIQQPKS